MHDVGPEDGRFAVHIYLETNGQPNLQEDGRGPLPDNPLLIQVPLCIPSPNPDTRLL